MRRIVLATIAVAALLCLAPQRALADWTWEPSSGWSWSTAPEVVPTPRREATAVVVPRGSHAHTRIDGSVFIHGDENLGKAAPHAGVALPWPKTALPGQTVVVSNPVSNPFALTAAGPSCPAGGCPTAFAPRASSTTTTASVTTTSRSGIFAGGRRHLLPLFKNRGARSAGGCP
jgi:hypothetical protein